MISAWLLQVTCQPSIRGANAHSLKNTDQIPDTPLTLVHVAGRFLDRITSGGDRSLLSNLTAMVWPSFILALAVTVSPACSAGSQPQADMPPAKRTDAVPIEQYHQMATPAVVPENAADRAIRRDLSLAIAQDPGLKDREISFLVSNGDVNVTGIVQNERERKKINEIAMGIAGVKSVANALRIAE